MNGIVTDGRPPPTPRNGRSKRLKFGSICDRLERYAHTSAWNLLGLLIIGAIFYVACYFAVGKTFLPGGKMWSLVLLWLAAHVAGFVVTLVGLHSLLGMVFVGVILVNIPVPWLIRGLPSSWTSQIRQAALALIFLRSGMELDIQALKAIGWLALRLLVVPTLWEAIISGTITRVVFGMPWFLCYTLGFILTAVGPAIVIQLMFDLQKEGFGVEQGIPETVVAAASFDDILAITFYTVFANVAIPGRGNAALHIAMGPLNILLGALAGPIGALICCPTKLWDTTFKRTAVLTLTVLLFKWLLNTYGFSDAGALAALSMGIITNRMWARGWPGPVSSGPNPSFAADAERYLGLFWKWIAQPLLFGSIGSGLNFLNGSVRPESIGKSLIVICSGWLTRFPVTFAMAWGGNRTWKEKVFLGVAWLPKATVQAALSGAPLDAIRQRGLGPEWVEWGQDIETTGILSIIVCASIGTMLIHTLAPICLSKAPGLTVRSVSASVQEVVAETGERFDTDHASKGRIVLKTSALLRKSLDGLPVTVRTSRPPTPQIPDIPGPKDSEGRIVHIGSPLGVIRSAGEPESARNGSANPENSEPARSQPKKPLASPFADSDVQDW